MTYREICTRFAACGIEGAEWDAACLIEHFCGTDLPTLRADPHRNYHSDALECAVGRRMKREPLQYILGEWEFYRQRYEVSSDCLIPRSDTEILVEEAIRRLPPNAHFADLCTGSGCIAISTLAERPDTRATAYEIFPATLTLALRNAQKNGVSERFEGVCTDILTAEPPTEHRFDAILSNPPYIATHELANLSPEVRAEPQAALDGGDDGLLFYRAILSKWTLALKKDGFCLLEIGYDQANTIVRLGNEHGFDVTVRQDLGGNDRVACLTKHS